MDKRAGSSQATWALLAEGVASARLISHKLRSDLSKVLAIVDSSDHKEEIYAAAGEVLTSAPSQIETLERHLDRTSYALSVLGEDNLRDVLPLFDRKLVDESLEQSKPLFQSRMVKSSEAVARRFLARGVDPREIGDPGGPCSIIHNIRKTLPPSKAEKVVDQVEFGEDVDSADVARIYPPVVLGGVEGTFFTSILLTVHAQLRMELRGITLPKLRLLFKSFYSEYLDLKSKQHTLAGVYTDDIIHGRKITWVSTDGFMVVFKTTSVRYEMVKGRPKIKSCTAEIITIYEKGQRDIVPGDGGCDDWEPI